MEPEAPVTKDNGGPFSEAKLLDIFAIAIYAIKDLDPNSKDSLEKQAYDQASALIAEKRRR